MDFFGHNKWNLIGDQQSSDHPLDGSYLITSSGKNNMELHDLVVIKTQPDEEYRVSQGAYGIVSEINSEYPTHIGIHKLELTGHISCAAVVPLYCLDVVNKTAPPQWRAAYSVWKCQQNQFQQTIALSEVQAEKILELIAGKHQIEVSKLKAILDELRELGVV